MKKNLLFLIALLLSLWTFGQSDYSRGFQNGYKVGYCYNDFGCIPPFPPITPMPRIRESQDNYQDGYNRGFKQGLEDKQAKKSSSSGRPENQGNYSAPYLGGPSYDPIEFARRKKLASQKAALEIQNQQSANFEEGIKRYSIEIEGWGDQIGYEELSKRNSAIRDGFIELNAAGLNLITPSSPQELMAYKALNEAMDDIKYKSSIWQSQNLAYDAATKIIFEQIIKKESERTIDIDATKTNMRTLLNTPGILNRSQITDNLIVYKPISKEIKVNSSFSTMMDVEGNVYKTVLIGTQIWMAENLRTPNYNDGTAIPLITDNTAWKGLTTPAYCWYFNDEASYNGAGALYNWFTVNTRKLCPKGWHVPTDAEWTTLTDYLGRTNADNKSINGNKLREAGTKHWNSPNTGATNESGFTALAGGWRYFDGPFFGIGSNGYWWSGTADNDKFPYNRLLSDSGDLIRGIFASKNCGLSVRCVRDY